MKRIRPYLLVALTCISSIIITILGFLMNYDYYMSNGIAAFSEHSPIEQCLMSFKNGTYLGYLSDTASLSAVDTVACFSSLSLEDEEMLSATDWDNITRKFTKVDDDYFKDALFIGDSRTVGIESYAGFENGTFYAATSMNIFDFSKKKYTIDGKKMTIEEALSANSFKKIYLMIGINDVGISTADTFFDTYKKVVDKICELQPDAIIFLEANLHVTKEKSDNDKVINNPNIEKRNKLIASLADQKKIFYIDINDSILCDKNGNLKEDYTWDQIHLQAKYYPLWKQFIMQKGIIITPKSTS